MAYLIEYTTEGVVRRWGKDADKIFEYILETDQPLFKVGLQMYHLVDYPYPESR